MSKRASPTLIGLFVVGAIALGVVGVAVFGSGRLFHDTQRYVLFFDSDVNGLRIGAPVKFKGVEIGAVKDILLNIGSMGVGVSDERSAAYIPVIIELDEQRIREKGEGTQLEDPRVLTQAINHGLRAQLALESFVTGLLYVKLDIYPRSPLRMVGDPSTELPEIPTLPTPLEQVQTRLTELLVKLEEVDFAGLIQSIADAAKGLDRLANSPKLTEAIDSLSGTLKAMEGTTASVRQLSEELRSNVGPLTESVRAASDSAQQTMVQAEQTLSRLDSVLQSDSPLLYQLQLSMEEVANAARSVRVLTESIERNPSMLVRGRAAPEEQ